MKDILLDDYGDLKLTASGDIQFTDSVRQAIAIRLRWFQNEWKLGPDYGIPYYDEVFVKNPSLLLLEDRMLDAVYDVKEVTDVELFKLDIDHRLRKLYVTYRVVAGQSSIEGRLTLDV